MILFTNILGWLASGRGVLLLAWMFTATYALAFETRVGPGVNPLCEFAFAHGLAFCMTSWVLRDARECGLRPCYDYDMFLFSAWGLLAPVHLFRTRGLKALLTIRLGLLLALSAWLAGAAMATVMAPVR